MNFLLGLLSGCTSGPKFECTKWETEFDGQAHFKVCTEGHIVEEAPQETQDAYVAPDSTPSQEQKPEVSKPIIPIQRYWR